MPSQLPFNPKACTEFFLSSENSTFDRGETPLHHLLMYVVHKLNDEHCRIDIASFSIGEDAFRCVAWIRENFPKSVIRILLDKSCKSNKMSYLIPLSDLACIRFNDIHAKYASVTRPDDPPVTILSSANLQNKNRWEIHTILNDADAVHLAKSFETIWNESHP